VEVHSEVAGGGVTVKLLEAGQGRERETLPARVDGGAAAVAAAEAAAAARQVRCLACMDPFDPSACVTCPQSPQGAEGAKDGGGGGGLHWLCGDCLDGHVSALADQASEGALATLGATGGAVTCPVPRCGSAPYADRLLAARLGERAWDRLRAARQALTEQRCEAAATRRLEEEKRRLAGLASGELRFLEAKDEAENRILCLACPACGQVFEDFSGCAALACSRAGCGRAFCGFCLADCGGDAHAHVRACRLGDGSWGNKAKVRKAQRRVAAGKLKDLLRRLDGATRERLLAHLASVLRAHGIVEATLR